MKYLLDTHVVLWVAENSKSLSDKAKAVILDVNIEKYVSIASAIIEGMTLVTIDENIHKYNVSYLWC
jgi:PIN domain nuclease of toxin-antitoxin system